MSTVNAHNLPADLRDLQLETEEHARAYGLDFYDTIFEVLDYDELSEIAALGGFPTRYPHWRFGMEYQQLSKGYRYGLQKIYEMVINNDPCYAYLLRCNQMVDQKLVMAHVYGHNDFFKNNIWFSQTNRKMMDEMANHGNRIRSYMERYGEETVENFIDSCLSLENLIDIHSPFIKRRDERQPLRLRRRRTRTKPRPSEVPEQGLHGLVRQPARASSRRRRKKKEAEKAEGQAVPRAARARRPPVPPRARPAQDLAARRAGHHPRGGVLLRPAGADQDHERGLGVVLALDDHDARRRSTPPSWSTTPTTTPGRWPPSPAGSIRTSSASSCSATSRSAGTRGSSAPSRRSATTTRARRNWDKQLGLGRQKIFEVRRIHNDVTFIDTFLTPDFCRRHQLFSFKHNDQNEMYEIESREFKKIKERLLFSLTNFGQPIIRVKDGNYRNRGELYLQHEHFGIDLKLDHAQDTLRHLNRLWTRPVHIETSVDGRPTLLSFDGTDHTIRPLGGTSHESEPKDRRRA